LFFSKNFRHALPEMEGHSHGDLGGNLNLGMAAMVP
jgi:hypothetical protein